MKTLALILFLLTTAAYAGQFVYCETTCYTDINGIEHCTTTCR